MNSLIWFDVDSNLTLPSIQNLKDQPMWVIEAHSPSKIILMPVRDYVNFSRMHSSMQTFYNNSTNRVPILLDRLRRMNKTNKQKSLNRNILCVVLFNGIWHRGRARPYKSFYYLVHVRLIDINGSSVFHKNDVQMLHQNFSILPGMRYNFALSNATPYENATWSFNSCERLKQLVEHRVVKVSASLRRNRTQSYLGTMTVGQDDVGKILVKEGFVRTANVEKRRLPIETLTFLDQEEGYVSGD